MPFKRKKRKLKVLQSAQKQFANVGIVKSNQAPSVYAFNKTILVGFFMLGGSVVAQIVYISHVANGFMDYVNSICSTSSAIIIFVCFAAIILRREAIFECIDKTEKIIHSSEATLKLFSTIKS